MSVNSENDSSELPKEWWTVAYTRSGGRYSETERLSSEKTAKRKRQAILNTYDDILSIELIQETQLAWDSE
ncbi:hypothetical protein SAMN04488556_4039 [Halostagnicola kamekurae]|uniref:Uncharacterized protein n=1 Tax=Halostagnicola kamekurae TaxID=619731 RepID=A0A1I6USF1_9EURY|nr:hypothetical protein SAMN04488556_4039 [Halostagnicola kamekurae]